MQTPDGIFRLTVYDPTGVFGHTVGRCTDHFANRPNLFAAGDSAAFGTTSLQREVIVNPSAFAAV